MSQTLTQRIRDLVKLLETLRELHQELKSVVENKVRAMKTADLPLMEDTHERESRLIETISEREGLRKQLMDLIGRELGLPPQKARRLKATELSPRLDREHGERVLSASRALRDTVHEVTTINHAAGLMAREMVIYFQRVFEAIGSSVRSPVGYEATGRVVNDVEQTILDALG